MKKVLFIFSPTLPFPPIKGGAVQNLVEQIVIANEYQENLLLNIASIYFPKIENDKMEYKFTNLKYINIPMGFLKIRDKQIKFISGRFTSLVEKIYLNGLKRILSQEHYDVVVFENTIKYSYLLREYLGKSKRILHLHNDYISQETKSELYLKEYDEVICISKYIEDLVLKKKINVKTKVIYNGINTSKFERNLNDRRKIREKLNIKINEKVVLFSGRIVKEKGVLELVKALEKCKEDLVLLILGSRIYGDNVNDQYTQKVLNEISKSKKRIIFTGFVPYDEIHKYYSASDIGVLPTLWEEPLSLSVIEYMSSGMPIIISNSGGMVELFEEGCGYIVKKDGTFVEDLTKAIDTILNDREFYKKACYKALNKSRCFDTKVYTDKMLKAIS